MKTICLFLLSLIFSTASSATIKDSLAPPPGAIQQQLNIADQMYVEGKVMYARSIYRQYRNALSATQKIRLGYSLILIDCDSSDVHAGADLLKEVYTSGNESAAPFLGWLYYMGRGLAQDTAKGLALLRAVTDDEEGWGALFKGLHMKELKNYTEALKYFKQAAKSGNSSAMVEIGALYQSDRLGQAPDNKKAVEWYIKAAEKGSGLGYTCWAWMCYYGGRDFKRDYKLAFQNFSNANKYGDAGHLCDIGLGHCYSFGIGTPKNKDSALFYYRNAGIHGQGRGYSRIGYIYEQGRDTEQRADSAIHNYARAADLGDSWACFRLAKIFMEGILVPRNDTLALRAISGGAELGDLDCMVELARYHKDGVGVEKNLEKCREILRAEELKGEPAAIYQLALIEDSLQRTDSAIILLKQSAAMDYSEAMLMLAKIYKRNLKNPEHEKLYTEWLDNAIKSGSTDALFLVGFEYCFGINRKQDGAIGNRLITSAARQGNRNAQDLIGLYPNVFGDGSVRYTSSNIGASEERDYAADYEPPFSGISVSAMDGHPDAQFLMGMKYFNGVGVKKNRSLAVQWFQQAAAQGHANSYLQLGYMYETGQGFSQNYTEAMTWYEMAAAKDVAVAVNNIGGLYYNGKGVAMDKEKAATYYEKAAAMGDPLAQSNLGYYLIYDCPPSKRNFKKGEALFMQSAQAQCDNGQYNLGMLYLKGEVVKKNEEKAEFWLERAALQNKMEAMQVLFKLCYNRGVTSNKMKGLVLHMARAGNALALATLYNDYKLTEVLSKEQEVWMFNHLLENRSSLNDEDRIALMEFYALGIGTEQNYENAIQTGLDFEKVGENANVEKLIGYYYLLKKNASDFKIAEQWYRKAIEKGNESAAYTLGYNYYSGEVTEVNDSLAYFYLKFAADKGHTRAKLFLGLMYENGRGVTADIQQALEWYEQAAKQNDLKAMYRLGAHYLLAEKVPQDKEKGMLWMERAASLGDVTAQGALASYLSQSKNKENQKKSVFWYEKAVEGGNEMAMNNLGECYYQGIGVKKDYEKARFYYQMAIDHKLTWGKLSMGTLYLHGHGVPKDEAKARELYKIACDEQIKEACAELEKLNKKN